MNGYIASACGVGLLVLGFRFYDLKKELKRQKSRLSKVLSVQNAIIEVDMNSERIMSTIADQTIKLTGADGATVEMLSGDMLIYRSAEGSLKNFLGFKIEASKSLSGLSIRKDESLICYDTETDDRVDREACRRTKVRSMIVCPLKYRGKLMGVLKAASHQPNFFNDEHVTILRFMVGILTTALAQAYQYEEKSSLVTMLQSDEIRLTHLKNRAEETARVKGELLASMSHEIRSPLNAILALTRMLSNSCNRAKQIEYIGGIQSSGKLLQMLMNNVLDFSSIESGKLELDMAVFDLEELLGNVKKAFLYQAQQKGVDVIVSLDAEVGSNVVGDASRLSQILMNLVGNALKFTAKGKIELVIRRVIDDGETKILFEVSDTGVGIQTGEMERLFHSFQQANASISRKFGGTGLGLSISKQLVELMGGSISVTSEPGVGSVFSFTALLPETDADLPKESLEDVRDSGDFKILVAEDNHINQMVTVDMLEQLGFSADTVASGKDAIAALKGQHYDLVLMDCQMPEMSGYEATSSIRGETSAGYSKVPIIAVTGNVFPGDRENCMTVGMNDYIPKPLEMKDLERVLARWLPKNRRNEMPAVATQEDKLEESKHIDLNRFKMVTGSFGPEKFNRISELVRVYLSSISEYIDAAENSYRDHHFDLLEKKVHAIKSSSENIGANGLGKIASDIESHCRHSRDQIQGEQVFMLRIEFVEVEKDLKKLLTIIDRNRISQVQKTDYEFSS